MHEMSSGILKIGVVNSGMFDTLELNTDVPAVHLVGDNNVGKTSLIELIQFLYFFDLRDMRFSKSLSESLRFYFRPEGSYLLFTVRTITKRVRTIGVYGTGTADSRQVFVFDGPFVLSEFLDDERKVLPLQRVGVRFADRRWYLYTRAEDYGRALIGDCKDDAANVQLFDFDQESFRLLRRLLQQLLRLDRLSASNIREALMALVENEGVKTRIDVAREFTQRYQRVRAIRTRIADVRRLQPLVERWTEACQRQATAQDAEYTIRSRLFGVGAACCERFRQQVAAIEADLDAVARARYHIEQQRQELANQLAEVTMRQRTLEQHAARLDQLRSRCAGGTEHDLRAERDTLIAQRGELERRLAQLHAADPSALQQQVQRLRRRYDEVQRRLASRTIDHLLAECDLPEDTRALARFLASERLLGMPVAEAVRDVEQLIRAVMTAATAVDAQGTFTGFGLSVPRAYWYRARDDDEPLAEQCERLQREIAERERDLAVAQDGQRVQREIQTLRDRIRELEQRIDDWRHLRDLETETGGDAALRGMIERCHRERADIEARQRHLGEQLAAYTSQEVDLRTTKHRITTQMTDISSVLNQLEPVDSWETSDVDGQTDDDLLRMFSALQADYRDQRNEVRRAEDAVRRAQAALEEVYDREGSDIAFHAWVGNKQEIIATLPTLEAELGEQYRNLITQVKGELDTLATAFDIVGERIVDLNHTIRSVSISNIARIEIVVRGSSVIDAIREKSRLQLDLFTSPSEPMDVAQAESLIEEYLTTMTSTHGRELSLDQLVHLTFRVTFAGTNDVREVNEIANFESNGTAIAVKIVMYLGLIRLLQTQSRCRLMMRIPFFLDEVGSLSSNNVREIIRYCEQYHFLPIFASPTPRAEMSHSYLLRRVGARSALVNVLVATDMEAVHADTGVA